MAGYTLPSNKVLVDGTPRVQFLRVETATNMIPGRLCMKGTAENEVLVNTVNHTPLGWIGFEQSNDQYKPSATASTAAIDVAYAINDEIAVLSGSIVVRGRYVASTNPTKGDLLVAAAAGELAKASAITATVPAGGTSVLSTSTNPAMTMAGAIPASGMIVGMAEGDVANASAAPGCVRSFI